MKLSPSLMDRLALCPGSFQAERGLPWTQSPYAEEGEMLHAVMNCTATQETLTGEQKLAIRLCVNAGADLVREHLGEKPQFVRERKLSCRVENVDVSGVLDFQAWDDAGTHVVIDWKFGRDPVDAAECNRQLRAYAVLAVANREAGFATKVIVAVVQPRVEFDRRVSVAIYTPEDIEAARREIAELAVTVSAADAPRIAGPKQCKYCKAAGSERCPESQQALVEIGAGLNLDLPTGEELSRYLKAAKVAEAVVKILHDHARVQLASDPASVPGWRLDRPMQVRAIPDASKAWERLSGCMEPEDFTGLCKVGVGDLQERLREIRGWSAKESKAKFNEMMGDALALVERQGALKEA